MDELIKITNLSKRYGNIAAIDDVTISIPRGKVVGLLGSNGSGKTTLIKVLANLILDYQGEVLINGEKPGLLSKSEVAYLPDSNFLHDDWNSIKAIEYFKDFFVDFDETKANDLIARLGVDPKQKFSTLSKGTKEKLQLVLILSRRAKLFLFDEPIAGVDPAARELIFRIITENRNPESTAIISTHLVSDAEEILDDIILLKNGKILMTGEADKLREYHKKSIDQLFREIYRC